MASLVEGPARAGPSRASLVELDQGGDAVAVRDDLAARDLRRVRDRRGEVLVGDPRGDDLVRLLGLLGRLEETEGADDALTGLDQVVAGEAGELAQVRDERLVDLGCELVRAGGVDTLVATNGRMHVLLLP